MSLLSETLNFSGRRTTDVEQLLKASRADFDAAVAAATAAMNAAPSPVMTNLIRAVHNYNRNSTDLMLAILQKLDDVHRSVSGVAARLDGREGPFSLRMR